ncbi:MULTISPECIES: hypothetical protein [unclassified Mucilaginibacter]|uniref:hypothetical protein n=1 Tax=unclassified Mucilaginibacter TaxID=2617802 RepID=UPI0031F6D2E2
MIVTMEQAADWQDIIAYRAMATPHDPSEESLADDDDDAFDDEMQDEEDLYELRVNEDSKELDPADDDHLPNEVLPK